CSGLGHRSSSAAAMLDLPEQLGPLRTMQAAATDQGSRKSASHRRACATGRITAVATLATPATSPSLAALIERIIADAGQDAEVHFGAGQPGVLGGAFPGPRDLTGSTFQRIDL